jgi:hypothetical protein
MAIFGQKPSRRFREPKRRNQYDKAEDDLEGNGEAPSEVRRPIGATIIDPVGNQCAKSNDAAFNAD